MSFCRALLMRASSLSVTGLQAFSILSFSSWVVASLSFQYWWMKVFLNILVFGFLKFRLFNSLSFIFSNLSTCSQAFRSQFGSWKSYQTQSLLYSLRFTLTYFWSLSSTSLATSFIRSLIRSPTSYSNCFHAILINLAL